MATPARSRWRAWRGSMEITSGWTRAPFGPVTGIAWTGSPSVRPWVDRWGPRRSGDGLEAPYTHVAAATQALLERAVLALIDGPLARPLAATRRLVLAGRLRTQRCAQSQPSSHTQRSMRSSCSLRQVMPAPRSAPPPTSPRPAATGSSPCATSIWAPPLTDRPIDAALGRRGGAGAQGGQPTRGSLRRDWRRGRSSVGFKGAWKWGRGRWVSVPSSRIPASRA